MGLCILSALISVVLASGKAQDFGSCMALQVPVGIHPQTGEELQAGTFEVTHSDDGLVANTVCDEEQGWLLTNKMFQELRCTYHKSREEWRWSHHHRDRNTPLQARCSYQSPKPIVQRFRLSNFEGCTDLTERDQFTSSIQTIVQTELPCAVAGQCVVSNVTCQRQGPGQALLSVTLRATVLQDVDSQRAVLESAAGFLRTVGSGMIVAGRSESGHGRNKRQFDPDAEPDVTDLTGCDDGYVNTTSGCSACAAGTYANTDDEECTACSLDQYSDGSANIECTDCSSGGTLTTGSQASTDCIDVCDVPTVGKTVSLDPDAGERVADGGDVTIACETDYTYDDLSTTTVSCDMTTNNFPDSCRKVTASTSQASVTAGEAAMLACEVLATDSATDITWYKSDVSTSTALVDDDTTYNIVLNTATDDGTTFTLTSSLEVLNFATGDVGTYACEADYTSPILDDVSTDITLSILDITIDPSTESVASAGDALTLTCSLALDSSYPTETFSWTFDDGTGAVAVDSGISSAETADDYTSELSLTLATTDAGTYECIGTYSTSDGSDTVSLSGSFSVVVRGFTQQPADNIGQVGDDMTITCAAVGDVEATITWYKDAIEVTSPVATSSYNETSLTTTSELAFTSATTDDSGSFNCTAVFADVTLESDIATVAVYDIGIESGPTTAGFLVGNDADISCTLKNPASLATEPAVVWFRVYDNGTEIEVSSDEGTSIFDGANPTGTSTLTLTSVDLDDADDYKCQATYTIDGTSIPKTSGSAAVYVREMSTSLSENTLFNLPSTATEIFECVYSGSDAPTGLTWTYDDTTLPSNFVETTGSYDEITDLWASSVTASDILYTSGGTIKCSFAVAVGDNVESESNFVVHSITDLDAEYVSSDSSYNVSCAYSGTDEPDSFIWTVNDVVIDSENTGFTLIDGTLVDNARTDILTVLSRTYSDVEKSITCKYTFTTPADTLEQSTTLIYRGIQSSLNAIYYTIGDDVEMELSLGVGDGGSAPSVTSWYLNYADSSSVAIDAATDDNYAIVTDTSVVNGLFKTTITISNINVDLAGTYKAVFWFSDTESYTSEGELTSRQVTITPSDAIVTSSSNAQFQMTCTISSSDTTTGVTWTGPSGVDVSGTSIDGDDYILTLTEPTSTASGAYTCAFAFSAGTAPSGVFSDININLVTSTSPSSVYTTAGGAELTLTCTLDSTSEETLYLWDGTSDLDADTTDYVDPTTTATFILDVTDDDAATIASNTYLCRKSATEYSVDSVDVTVLQASDDFGTVTSGIEGDIQTLTCSADYDAAVALPTIEWKLQASDESTFSVISGAVEGLNDDGSQFISALNVTVGDATDGNQYKCDVVYSTGLSASVDFTSDVTTVSLTQMSVDGDDYQISAVGTASIVFTCIAASSDSSITISWRKDPVVDGETTTYTDLASSASTDAFNTTSGTITSYLTYTTVALTDDSDSIECYVTGQESVSSIMELNIIEITAMEDAGAIVGGTPVFNCDATILDQSLTLASVTWYTRVVDIDTEVLSTVATSTMPSEGQYVLTLLSATHDDAGDYLCKVSYNEDGTTADDDTYTAVNADSVFESDTASLYVRSWSEELPTATQYIHNDGEISLLCEINVASDDTVSSVKWFKTSTDSSNEISNPVLVTVDSYDTTDATQNTTYNNDSPAKDDGGAFICQFNFDAGDPMESTATVAIHFLEDLQAVEVNPSSLVCTFEGSNDPTITWSTTAGDILDSDDADAYTVTVTTAWDSAALTETSTLTIDLDILTDNTDVTCSVTFDDADVTDPISTTTDLQRRFISESSDATVYTIGESSVVLSCTLNYGATGGTGPDSVAWNGIPVELTETTDYVADLGSDSSGVRTTTLTLLSVDSVDYAANYTCMFTYADGSGNYDSSSDVVVRLSSVTSPQAYVHTNAGFDITCTFAGNEDPTVTWTITDGSEITNAITDYTVTLVDKVATLSKVNPSSADDSIYTCQWSVGDGTGDFQPSSTFTITVALLEFTNPSNYYGTTGYDIVFTCTVKSEDSLTIYWFKDSDLSPVSTSTDAAPATNLVTAYYTITTLDSSSHDGVYQCRLSNSLSTEISDSDVTLTTLDFTTEPTGVENADVGDTVDITCISNYAGSGIDVAVVWFFEGSSIIDSGYTSEATDTATGWESVLGVTMSSSISSFSYFCEFSFTGTSVGTVGAINSSEVQLFYKCANPTIASGTVSPDNTIDFEATFSVSCNTGYTASSEDPMECQDDGTLNVTHTCEINTCSQPTIADGTTSPNTSIIDYLETYTLTCSVGYTASSDEDMNCTSDGSLDVTHTCAINTCSQPTIADGTTSPDTITIDYLETYTLTCSVGYTASSVEDMNCQANGTLSATHTCSINTCDKPSITFGVLSPLTPIDFGSQYSLSCENDYTASSADPMNCTSDGTLDVEHTCQGLTGPLAVDFLAVGAENFTATCIAYGDDPALEITWSFAGGALPTGALSESETFDDTNNLISSTLSIASVTADHRGNYTCQSTASLGLDATMVLDVYEITPLSEFSYSPDNIDVIFEGTYEPDIAWTIDDGSFTDTQAVVSVLSAWDGSSITFRMELDMSAFSEGTDFVVNADLSYSEAYLSGAPEISTSTTVYKREMTTPLPATDTINYDEDTKTFTCVASGGNDTVFSFMWYLGDNVVISDSGDSTTNPTITDTAVTDNEYRRESVLTIDNNSPDYNNDISCAAVWTSPENYTLTSTSDVNAIGAAMNSNSFSDADGNGVMVCTVWDNSVPTSVGFTDEDGNDIVAIADDVTVVSEQDGSTTTYTVTYLDMQFGDEGNYTCNIEFNDGNTLNLITYLTKLTAKFIPTSPYFVHDGIVAFTCAYIGSDDPLSVSWYTGDDYTVAANEIVSASNPKYTVETGDFNSATSTKYSVITFVDADVTDSGDYTCLWSTDNFSPSATMEVVIRSLSLASTTTYSLDGDINLECNYDGTATGNVTWYYESTALVSGTDSVTATDGELVSNAQVLSLSIEDVSANDDAGTYSCVVEFDDGDEISAETEVVIRKATIVDNDGDTVDAILVTDSELKASCRFQGDAVPTDVMWYKGSDLITFDASTYIQNTNTKQLTDSIEYFSNITLKSFTSSEEGNYTCEFSLSPNTVTQSVSVLVASISNEECVFIDLRVEATKELSCSYTGSAAATAATFNSNPAVLGSWTEGDAQDATYTLSSITEDSSGVYTCAFDLSYDQTISALSRVTARQAVVTTSSGLTPELIVGATITLTCNVTDGAKSITWYKDNTDAAFEAYDEVRQTGTSDDLVSEVYFDIADSSAGIYWCQANYYDDFCSTQETFESENVTLSVIAAEPKTQPASATVYEGAASAAIFCVFPNPFPSITPEIDWSFNGNVLLSNGDYYANNELIIDGAFLTDTGDDITTTLTITDIDEDVEGDYTCSIQWGTIFITSDAATLTVRSITTDPETTNVADGGDAVLSCVARGDIAPTITFIDSTGASVDTVLSESETVGDVVTTTGTLTLSGVTSASAGDYYCRATWDGGYVDSETAYLTVLGMEEDSMEDTAWGVADQVATFRCLSGAQLLSNNVGDAYVDEDGNSVYAAADISWEYYDTSSSSFVAASDSKFTVSQSMVGSDGIRTSPLVIGPLTTDDEGLLVRCVIAYTSDSSNNFYGSTVTSGSLTLHIASVTSFTISSDDVIKGDTFTLTCVAQGETVPDFYITTRGTQFDASKFSYVSGPDVTTSGTEYTAEYVTTADEATVLQGGITMYCEADYGTAVGSSKTSLDSTAYYNCEDVSITVLGADLGVSIEYADSDGTRTATVSCPANTDSVRYSMQADSSTSAESATCSKNDGKYSPTYLSTCLETLPLSTGNYEISYDLSTYDGFTICDETTSTTPYDYTALQAMMIDSTSSTCGPYSYAPCLIADPQTCTLTTANTGCLYDTATLTTYFYYEVELNTPVWSLAERNALVLPTSGNMKVFGCGSKRRRRDAIGEEMFESLLVVRESSKESLLQAQLQTETEGIEEAASKWVVWVAGIASVVTLGAVSLLLARYRRKENLLLPGSL